MRDKFIVCFKEGSRRTLVSSGSLLSVENNLVQEIDIYIQEQKLSAPQQHKNKHNTKEINAAYHRQKATDSHRTKLWDLEASISPRSTARYSQIGHRAGERDQSSRGEGNGIRKGIYSRGEKQVTQTRRIADRRKLFQRHGEYAPALFSSSFSFCFCSRRADWNADHVSCLGKRCYDCINSLFCLTLNLSGYQPISIHHVFENKTD